MTTCPLICVATSDDCPTSCDDDQLTLCNDGTCQSSCDDTIESPCECDDLMFACPKVIDYYESCQSLFELEYQNYSTCITDQEESLASVSFTGPWFMVCYCWISIVSVLVVSWCAYNQKMAPIVESSEQTLIPIFTKSSSDKKPECAGGDVDGLGPECAGGDFDGLATNGSSNSEWTLTGYRKNWIGLLIYFLVLMTIVGFQFLLFLLTIFYYMQQEAITRWAPVFHDEAEVLLAFE